MKNLTGQAFGRLTAVRSTQDRQRGEVVWECRCSCGKETLVASGDLRSGRVKSCGCLQKEQQIQNGKQNGNDLTGQRFGRLVAVKATEKRYHGSVIWECRCDCGNRSFVRSSYLRSGRSKSCGCWHSEHAASFGLRTMMDLTGQRFGRLVAVRPTERRVGSSVVWECKCDCGTTTFANQYTLKSGDKVSCGCLRKKRNKKSTSQP